MRTFDESRKNQLRLNIFWIDTRLSAYRGERWLRTSEVFWGLAVGINVASWFSSHWQIGLGCLFLALCYGTWQRGFRLRWQESGDAAAYAIQEGMRALAARAVDS